MEDYSKFKLLVRKKGAGQEGSLNFEWCSCHFHSLSWSSSVLWLNVTCQRHVRDFLDNIEEYRCIIFSPGVDVFKAQTLRTVEEVGGLYGLVSAGVRYAFYFLNLFQIDMLKGSIPQTDRL